MDNACAVGLHALVMCLALSVGVFDFHIWKNPQLSACQHRSRARLVYEPIHPILVFLGTLQQDSPNDSCYIPYVLEGNFQQSAHRLYYEIVRGQHPICLLSLRRKYGTLSLFF